MPRKRLVNGKSVTVHTNDGLRKRCSCSRRAWATCSHPWHFSHKERKGPHHRFPLDKYAHLFDYPLRTKANATKAATHIKGLILDKRFPPAAAPAPTTPTDLSFADLADKWITNDRKHCSDNQRTNDRGIMRRLGLVELEPGVPLSGRPIGLLTVTDFEKAFDGLGPLAASSRNKYLQAVKLMEAWALDTGHLTRRWLVGRAVRKGGPLARRKGAKRTRRLIADVLDDKGNVSQPGEERRLLGAAGPWLQRFIIAALETCCRAGELLSLQWQDVSLTRGLLTVRAENAKTRTARHVPISPRLRAVLELIRNDPNDEPHKPLAYVFGDPTGAAVPFPKKAWETCVLKAHGHAPKWDTGGKLSAESRAVLRTTNLHFHDLRHEAGSRLADQGWPLHHVQHVLGHADLKQTSTYLNADIRDLQSSMEQYGTGSDASSTAASADQPDQPLHAVARDAQIDPPPSGNADLPAAGKSLVN
ncbi:MAG: tyrosine-type recombinase/integrase [Vicinamibacterales bacterium]